MTNLNTTEAAIYNALVAEVESINGEWGTVYLSNVVAAVSEKQFSGYLSALEKKGLYRKEGDDDSFGYVKMPKAKQTIKTTKIGAGHYRIEREDGHTIEVRKLAKNKWVDAASGATQKTMAGFEYDMENGFTAYDQLRVAEAEAAAAKAAEAPAKAPKAKAEKKASKSANYKGHRNQRTADLHRAYDEMERSAALKYATETLGYTVGGASSWFSDWDKEARASAVASS